MNQPLCTLLKSHWFLPLGILTLCLAPRPLPAQSTPGTSSPWVGDFQEARKTAGAAKKDLAILFTASDWLDLAQTFDREILSKKAFLDTATQHYTLVRLDFPKEPKSQPSETMTQNQMLMRAYRIRGFPTLVLADALGRPYAITGYHDAGLDTWIEEFNQLRQTRKKRDRFFGEAKKATGVERAKLLDQALPELPGNLVARYYPKAVDEIIQLDPDNETGRVGYYKLLIADVRYANQMQKLGMAGQSQQMLELSDRYLKEARLKGTTRQSVLFNKIGIYEQLGRSADVARTLRDIVAIDPTSSQGKQAAKRLESLAPKSKNGN